MQRMVKFSSIIRFLQLRELKWGSLVLYKIMFLVAFRENLVGLFAGQRRAATKWAHRRPHGERENIWTHSPVLNVDVNVFCLCFVAQ